MEPSGIVLGEIFSRIEHVRTADEVVQQIESLILEGVLRVADRLPAERELARQFDVSRPILRDALKVLEQRGLIVTRHWRRHLCRRRDRPGLHPAGDGPDRHAHRKAAADYLEYRREVEGIAAEFAARRATDDDRALLAEIMLRMQEAAHARGDFEEEAAIDVEFHNAIGECAHNIVLLHTLRSCYRLLSDGVFQNRLLMFALPGARERAARPAPGDPRGGRGRRSGGRAQGLGATISISSSAPWRRPSAPTTGARLAAEAEPEIRRSIGQESRQRQCTRLIRDFKPSAGGWPGVFKQDGCRDRANGRKAPRRPVRHLPRRPVPPDGRLCRDQAARGRRLHGRRADGADLLRPAGLQFRRPRRQPRHRRKHHPRLRGLRLRRRAVGLLRGHAEEALSRPVQGRCRLGSARRPPFRPRSTNW